MKIEILDENLKKLGLLRKYDFAQYTERTRDIGEFQINARITDNNVYLLDKSRQFYVLFDDKVFGRIETVKKDSDSEFEKTMEVVGVLSKKIFTERVIVGTLKYKGNTAGFIEALIKSEMVNNKDENRNMDIQFVYENKDQLDSICSLVDKEVTGGYVWDEIKTSLDQDRLNLSFDPVVETTHLNIFGKETNITKWVAKISAGADRTVDNEQGNKPVIFSQELHNIQRTSYTVDKTKHKNIAYVAGEGEAEQRKWYEVYNKNTRMMLNKPPDLVGWKRRELWVDARDVQSETDDGQITPEQYDVLIVQRADEKFTENTEVEEYESTLTQDKRYVYGRDYNKGDYVTIKDKEIQLETQAQITGVQTSVQGNQTIIDLEISYGTMRTDPVDSIPVMSAKVSKVQNDVKYIEGTMTKQQRQIEQIKKSSFKLIEGNGFEAKQYENGKMEIIQTCSFPFVIKTPWKSWFSDKFDLGSWAIPFVDVPRIVSVTNVSSGAVVYTSLDRAGKITSERDIGEAWFSRPEEANYPNSLVHVCVSAIGRWR